MNIKNIVACTLITFLLVSCSPYSTATPNNTVIPAKTAKSTPTIISLPTLAFIPYPTSTPVPKAVISVDYQRGSFDRGGSISVANISDVIAKNVKVWICASQTSSNWQRDFQGINSLTIESHGLSSGFGKKHFYNTHCFPTSKIKSPNILLFSIESLPAWQDTYLTVKMNSDTPKNERMYKGTVYIKTPADGGVGNLKDYAIVEDLVGKFGDPLVDYLGSKGSIGDLYVEVACDNCSTIEKNYTYYFLGDKGYLAGCKVLEKNNSFTKMSCYFSFAYYIPNNSSDLLPQNEDLYIFAFHNADNENMLVEVTKEEFENSVP